MKKRAKKWLFFSDAVPTRSGTLVKPAIELWSLTIRYNPSGVNTPPYQRAGQEHHHKKTCTRYEMTLKQQQSFSSYAPYRRDNNLRDSLVRSALNNTTATKGDRGTFPYSRTRCNSFAHTDSSASIASSGGHITVLSKGQRKRCVCD